MKFGDEELLKLKNLKLAQEENTEEEDQKGSVEVEYERRYFVEGKISMEVPKDSTEIDAETIRFVFYGESKPQYVIESESTEVAVGYNYTEVAIENDDIFRFGGFASKLLETMGPGVKIFKVKNQKMEDFNLSVVEFTSKGFDGGIFNFMFYISLEGKLLISFVIIPSRIADKRREIAEHIIESVRIENEDNKDS